jgi:hypothetical protein
LTHKLIFVLIIGIRQAANGGCPSRGRPVYFAMGRQFIGSASKAALFRSRFGSPPYPRQWRPFRCCVVGKECPFLQVDINQEYFTFSLIIITTMVISIPKL